MKPTAGCLPSQSLSVCLPATCSSLLPSLAAVLVDRAVNTPTCPPPSAHHTTALTPRPFPPQGGGKRKGAFAIYLEPWHADIFDWLDLRKNHGKEEARARDLFYGLWINDLFMQRVEANEDWSLFCPNEAPGLADVWGEEFEALYTK